MSKKNQSKSIKKSSGVKNSSKRIGRPSKYKPEFDIQAERLSMLGLTDKQLSEFFEVNEDSIHEWKKVHPSFSESLKRGKEHSDAIVVRRLFERATGYEHEEVDIKMYKGKIIKTKLIKHYPPDTVAAIFWLKNRRPKEWRDKVEQQITGNVSLTVSETKFSIKVKGQ